MFLFLIGALSPFPIPNHTNTSHPPDWINVRGRHDYIINVIDNVLVALFAILGDGPAPFRIVDTSHICFIAHYHHLTWRLRRERALPQLQDHKDLPAIQPSQVSDIEKQDGEYSVLCPEQ